MSKRKCVNRTEQEKINLLKEWRDNPEWDIQEASRRLGVKEATLRGWKKLYWHRLDSFVGSKRKRKKGKGPGPRRKLKPYEDRLVDYFFSLREKGKCRFGDILFYCQNIDDFLRDFPELSGQKSWVDRFIKHYSKKVDSEDDGVSGGVGTCSGGDGPNSGRGGANSDHLVTNSGGCDGEEANSDRVVVNSDGGKDNPDSGGAKSDSEGDTPDKEADKSDRGGANTDSDAARSGGTVVQKAGVSGDDENCVRSGDESVSGEASIARKKGTDAAQDVNESSGHDECMFGGAGDASSGESAASSGCASDSDDSLFEIDTHEKKTPACPKKQIFFRKRHPKNHVVLEWSGADKYVCLFPRDLNCLLPDQLLTETTLDYFVHRYMKPAPGVLCFCGTDLYRSIEFAWR
ncbi:hypothetical protein PF002_g30896 [Phytophthora fragariae]|uniref:Uncharacterized protein n=2 Tax=Phytophthora fragariae TaxID=53985 RepID=A0A6A3VLI0_9STRA|nr:hypothetical protein PF002_g30896 [Phytophthora fragariae]